MSKIPKPDIPDAGSASSPQPVGQIAVLSDYVVVKAADLQLLREAVSDLWDSSSEEGCETPLFVGDMMHLNTVRHLAGRLHESKPLDQALRRVDGDPENGNAPILVVLPQGVDDQSAEGLMNAAIEAANQDTNFGKDGGYFEALQERLFVYGIAITGGIEQLRSTPWDADAFGGPELDDGSGEYLNVVFPGSSVEDDELDTEGRLADDTEAIEVVSGSALRGFCIGLDVTYPRADRHGVPDMATYSGAAAYIRQITSLQVHKDFEVEATDSGDDSSLTFAVRALVHKDCVRVIEQDSRRQREGEQ